MSTFEHSDDGSSDLDIILDDDVHDSEPNTLHVDPLKPPDTDKNSKKLVDDEPGNPYLPRLKTSTIQVVLNINAELIRLCNEYQNNSLMDDPQLQMYQMRLQSNLAYLASVADSYLDPTLMPDLRPLPQPTLASCQGSTIMARLAHARAVYAAYASAWGDAQMELSKRAKSARREEEKNALVLERGDMHEQVEELLKQNRVAYDKSADEPIAPESFVPFPPFRVPSSTRLPPGLHKWSFSNNFDEATQREIAQAMEVEEDKRHIYDVTLRHTTRCWETCVFDAKSSTLSSRETACFENCVNRFMESANIIFTQMRTRSQE
ncbi:hypothetical protein GGH96_005801 [Coemansia sp. RSA 1972]|nr:hypothetical protein GGH96_005801 [Coemansia sp. RSA 1972]